MNSDVSEDSLTATFRFCSAEGDLSPNTVIGDFHEHYFVCTLTPSPHGFTLPPCDPLHNGSPYPRIFPVQKVWCVAKPSVPEETLQQAMDYACGEGGADCMEIMTQGNCYYPDTVIAHASYATATVMEEKLKEVGGVLEFKVEAGKAINDARGGCRRRCGSDLSGTAKTVQ
ncbi:PLASMODESMATA CALLOSE-BINDING PROTEIN 4-like [Vigna radiata var. radiata]|uniref:PLASMODESMATA CALLOSE-BINDING PROTEIN 4-like n=1 Tax=Vigna radiata var. radiata TaxID=3916 RepID=A0A3Q0F814_VIGRR|nr:PLASMODESMATA CALLOSE-BINDING PROTEIN 4-like [Vigna radiata var. radiata]